MVRLKFFIFLFFIFNLRLCACNLSDLTVLSVTGTGPYVTTVRLCVGYGKTGSTSGADANTRSISFAFYKVGGITLSAYTPASITSARGFSNCTMTGANIGAQGPPYNSQATLIYVDPGYYGIAPCVTQPYACITTTALCGSAAVDCKTFTFTTNFCPDSIRAFGVEGNGNPVGGCFANPDMGVNVCYSPLPLLWDDISSEVVNNGKSIKINWSTFSEINNNYFTVQRATDEDATTFENIGMELGTNTMFHKNYSFIDNEPKDGVSFYRVMQTDYDGLTSYTRLIVVYFYSDDLASIKIFPNPASDFLAIEGFNIKRASLVSVFGAEVYSEKHFNNGLNRIDISPFANGLYYLKVETIDGTTKNIKVEINH